MEKATFDGIAVITTTTDEIKYPVHVKQYDSRMASVPFFLYLVILTRADFYGFVVYNNQYTATELLE